MNARYSALLVLLKVKQGQPLPKALATTLVEPKDTPFRKALCTGVCRWYSPLKHLIDSLITKPLKSKDQDIELAIMLGIFQLHGLNTPAYAAIHETTALAKPLKKIWAKGLINAVLRKAQASEYLKQPSLTPFPEWLHHKLSDAWPEAYQTISHAHLQEAPISLRVNRLKISQEAYMALLTAQNTAYSKGSLAPYAVTNIQTASIQSLPGYEEGLFSVQDEAAQLAAEFLKLAPQQRVLDACAAPGGKSLAILETCPDIGALTLIEKDAERAHKILENFSRHQISSTRYQLNIADANDLTAPWAQQGFDRILLDAPCSATGITRRHPDILLLRQAQDIESLTHQQAHLLNHLWTLLTPGGYLLYCTCSILPEENQHQIAAFLTQHPNCAPVSLAEPAAAYTAPTAIGLQCLPSVSGSDGFYYALLQKTSAQ